MSVLYISYNGLLEPLGQSQVFQYLRQLAAKHKIVLVTYEKKQDRDNKFYFQDIAKLMRESDILWIPLSYHKQPAVFSTFYDLLVGSVVCFYVCCRYRIRIVHARAYVPAVLGWMLQKVFGLKFIFDMRSFWPDDLLEAGILKRSSIIYKTAKWLEHQFLISADVVIALTHKAVDVMKGYPFLQKKKVHFEIIPTCVNLDLFRPALCKQDGSINKQFFTLGYVGNAGPLYLFTEALRTFGILLRRRSEAMFLIVNRDDHGYILECLQKQGISPKNFKVKSAEHRCVPLEIAQMDAGVFFYAQTNSHASRAPTKLGEFLALSLIHI